MEDIGHWDKSNSVVVDEGVRQIRGSSRVRRGTGADTNNSFSVLLQKEGEKRAGDFGGSR